MRKSNSIFDLKIIIIFLNLALFTRFYIIPFASYSAFLSSSSNLVYLTAVCFINSISGVYLLKNTIYLFKNLLHFDLAVFILCALTIAASLIIILFEKNIKIIFGYTYAVINSLFLSSYIYFKNSNIIIYIYFVINLLVFSILAFAFFENKYEFSKRLITKQKGFILEKIYILLFEKFPLFISNVINFLDKKIVQNAMRVLILFIDLIITKIFLKSQRPKTQSKAKQILIFFAIIAVFAIFIALFGGADVK